MKSLDIHQRCAYAIRRLCLAIKRTIQATHPADEERAFQWVSAWAAVARLASAPPKDSATNPRCPGFCRCKVSSFTERLTDQIPQSALNPHLKGVFDG